MSIKRITISVPAATASRIKKAAGAIPVSAWVTDVIEEHLNDVELERQWQAFQLEVRPSRKDVTRAEAMFERLVKPGSRKGAA